MQTDGTPQSSTSTKRKRTTTWILFAALLLLVIAAVAAFRGVGRWLIREDPLAKSDVIVVLSGAMPARAEEAARVFRMGYAPEVWVSRPESAAGELQKLGVAYSGEEVYNREALIQEGVPASAIEIFPQPIVDTEEEVQEIVQQMHTRGKDRVIIVTSPQHTRRVRALWKKMADPHSQLIVHAAYQDTFDADRWWATTRDTYSVARELMGLLNVEAGFPVHPRQLDDAEKPAMP